MGVHNRPCGDGRHGGSSPPMPDLRRGIPAPATGDVQTARALQNAISGISQSGLRYLTSEITLRVDISPEVRYLN